MTETNSHLGLKALRALTERNYSENTIDNLAAIVSIVPNPSKVYKEILEYVEKDPTEKELWYWTQEKMDEYIPR